jgi:transcriptional regulator with XRE-family HTH domain
VENLIGGRITLGTLIEAIRRGEEATQVELAAKLGVTKSHLCDIERGRKLVSPERASRFAALLGYSSDQFVRLALQDAVDRAGLHYKVEVTAA